MTDEQIIKALECCCKSFGNCTKCPYKEVDCVTTSGKSLLLKDALDLINRQKAEIERLHKLQKPTEASGFKIEDGKVVFYTNMLNGYRHELKDLDEVVEELNLMLQEAYKTDEIAGYLRALQEQYKTAKSEAIKEFAKKYKEYIKNFTGRFTDGMRFTVNLDAILFAVDFVADKLVKEMTEPVKIEHSSLCETETYMGE